MSNTVKVIAVSLAENGKTWKDIAQWLGITTAAVSYKKNKRGLERCRAADFGKEIKVDRRTKSSLFELGGKTMKEYTVTTTEELRTLCIENNWFTCGTASQYEKLFYANEMGCPIEEIATIIWLCSDDVCRRDILDELKAKQERYLFSIGKGGQAKW